METPVARYVDAVPLREVPLEGGDVTEGVVRVGDTVRRPVGPASRLVREVLGHLEAVGFEEAPRFLGVDVAGRDVLTFVPGDVAGRPWPAWVAGLDTATGVARLVRRYDDAVSTLGLPDWATAPDDPAGAPASIAGLPELLGHLDVTPENVFFRHGQAAALIDFDWLRPATRVEEVTNILLWWGGWMPPDDREHVLREIDPAVHGAAIVEAYGLTSDQRMRLVDTARNSAERSWYSMRRNADERGGGWRRMWDDGLGDRILRRQAWLAANGDTLEAAIR